MKKSKHKKKKKKRLKLLFLKKSKSRENLKALSKNKQGKGSTLKPIKQKKLLDNLSLQNLEEEFDEVQSQLNEFRK